MKSLQSLFVLSLFSVAQYAMAQFTDEINSNRPGRSMMAFSVGKSIFQAESGINYISEDHKALDYKANGLIGEFDVRWGLFFEQLEFIAEILYQNDTYTSAIQEKNRIQLENNDHLVAEGIYVAGTLAGWRSQLAIAAGSGACVATDILTLWNDGNQTHAHDSIKK